MQLSRLFIAFASWLLIAGMASAQQEPDAAAERVRRYIEFAQAPLRYPVPDKRVVRTSHEVGKRKDGSAIIVDVTLPEARGGVALPVVVLLHGGLPDEATIRPSTWRVYKDWSHVLAANGIGAVMFDHTLGSPDRRLDQALGEVDAVLAWLAAHGRALGMDTDRTDVFAFSAGGLLVPAILSGQRPLPVDGAVLFYPSTGIVPGSPGESLTSPATATRMSLQAAAVTLAKDKADLLIFRAGQDEIPGLLPVLDQSVRALLGADARVQVINVPGVPHGFDAQIESPDVRAAIEQALAFPKRPRDGG